MLEPARSRIKENPPGTGLLQCQTERVSAGMPMPAALALMPMPSYAEDNKYKIILLTLTLFWVTLLSPKYGMPSRIMYNLYNLTTVKKILGILL
jgi:hypothetical protein